MAEKKQRWRAEWLLLALLLVALLFPDQLGQWATSLLPAPPTSARFELTARETPAASRLAEPGPAGSPTAPAAASQPPIAPEPASAVPAQPAPAVTEPTPTLNDSASREASANQGEDRAPKEAHGSTFQMFAAPGKAPAIVSKAAPVPAFDLQIPPAADAQPGQDYTAPEDVEVPMVNPFIGMWEGTYSGADQGSFFVTIHPGGSVLGQGTSVTAGARFDIRGLVSPNGTVHLQKSATDKFPGGTFGGHLLQETGSGAWSIVGMPSVRGQWTAYRSRTSSR